MKTILIVLLIIISTKASGQHTPRPVSLPIQNIMQQTNVWCWAAVAQQIIFSIRGRANTPPQCALVAMANGVDPNYCCAGSGNTDCVKTGSLQQIQYLIAEFGGRFTGIQPPANAMILYNTLASGRPIILQVRTGQSSAHVVVLTGMSFEINNSGYVEAILHINDPMAYFNQPVPFSRLINVWMSAIVVG